MRLERKQTNRNMVIIASFRRTTNILANLVKSSCQITSHRTNVTSRFNTKRISGQAEAGGDATRSIIAYNLSERLRIDNAQRLLKNFEEYQVLTMPNDLRDVAIALSLKPSGDRVDNKQLHDVFLFEEGSIVFWGVPYAQQKRILYGLASIEVDPHSKFLIEEEKEHMSFQLTPSIEKSRLSQDVIHLVNNENLDTMRLDQFAVSHAIALSVKLAIWESKLNQYIDSVSCVTADMKMGKSLTLTRKEVFRKTGEIYELKHHINLGSDLLDLPDVYWDRHDQEILFLSLTSYLNIKKRTTVINEKLNNCCELINLLANHMNDKHHLRLEWMIIALILVEVLFEIARFV